MAYGRITQKQQEILDYIKNEILNRGFPPAVREICEAVGLKSTSSVHSHLELWRKTDTPAEIVQTPCYMRSLMTISIWYVVRW